MKIVIDADIIAHQLAYVLETEGLDMAKGAVEEKLEEWTPKGYAMKDLVLAFSCSRDEGFRRELFPDYKIGRTDPPRALKYLKKMMQDRYNCIMEPGLEADDLLGIAASSKTAIAVTIDKDLLQVPGYHWNPDKNEDPWEISELRASWNFHRQWLMGDSTDGLKGIPKMGPKTAENKVLLQTAPQNWTNAVLASYEQAGLSYDYALSMARCVRILRKGEWTRKGGIKLWTPPGFE